MRASAFTTGPLIKLLPVSIAASFLCSASVLTQQAPGLTTITGHVAKAERRRGHTADGMTRGRVGEAVRHASSGQARLADLARWHTREGIAGQKAHLYCKTDDFATCSES